MGEEKSAFARFAAGLQQVLHALELMHIEGSEKSPIRLTLPTDDDRYRFMREVEAGLLMRPSKEAPRGIMKFMGVVIDVAPEPPKHRVFWGPKKDARLPDGWYRDLGAWLPLGPFTTREEAEFGK